MLHFSIPLQVSGSAYTAHFTMSQCTLQLQMYNFIVIQTAKVRFTCKHDVDK